MNHSLWRNRDIQKQYRSYVRSKPPTAPCDFCVLNEDDEQVISNEHDFWVVTNQFPYTVWDSFFVENHLMLVPKRHVDSISGLKPEELIAHSRLLAYYEKQGFSLYSRAANNSAKSIAHQHTHLIKVSARKVSAFIYLRVLGMTLFR